MTQVDILSGVVLENFIPPRDGMWCLRIDKEEVLCNGDEKFNIKTTVDVPLDVKEKHMVLEVVLRNHFQRLVVFDGSTSNYGNQENIGKNLKTTFPGKRFYCGEIMSKCYWITFIKRSRKTL